MKFERIIWIALTIVILAALVMTYSRLSSLEKIFLVQHADQPYEVAATKFFIKEEGASESMISHSFYISYLGFSDRSCIRFVPRARVYGGATTYCFSKGAPTRLIGVDREGE